MNKPLYLSVGLITSLAFASCQKHQEEHHEEHHKIVATSPIRQDVTVTQEYVCQIHSCRRIEMCAIEEGYLEEVLTQEGRHVQEGDLLFKIAPAFYKAELDAEKAEADLVAMEYKNTQKLVESNVVSQNELALVKAKLDKAQAKVALAQAHLKFTEVKAPFAGIIGLLENQKGSLIEKKDILTTLADNSTMWVYFNVPEARYLEYKSGPSQEKDLDIELLLANHEKFPQPGKISVIESTFNNETGNIQFRADFPNPQNLLRHGQTGTILIHRLAKDAIVIPQRATFEILDKHFVFVVGEDGVVHQRKITVQNELEDRYVIGEGLTEKDRIVLDGIREVQDGEKAECEFKDPKEAMKELKHEAE